MALSHHAIVHLAALRLKINDPNNHYVLLGDDIAISHPVLAEKYRMYMTYFLGVKFSASKEISGVGIGEFCKRLYKDGKEVFNIPPTLIKSLIEFPQTSAECIKEIEYRSVGTGLKLDG